MTHRPPARRLDRMQFLARPIPVPAAASAERPEKKGGFPPAGERAYLSAMAPNVKGETFAWLDPSTLYINAAIFRTVVDDLVAPFDPADVDVVAGFDAMGFVLGSAMAVRLGKGFLTLRKAGKLPVESDTVEFVNYSGRTQQMEMRTPAFRPGTRVLLVDQWVETGGTMDAGVRLVEGQGGVVAGIATVCIEENERTRVFRERYQCSTSVPPGSEWQRQCNAQRLDTFEPTTPPSTSPTPARPPPDLVPGHAGSCRPPVKNRIRTPNSLRCSAQSLRRRLRGTLPVDAPARPNGIPPTARAPVIGLTTRMYLYFLSNIQLLKMEMQQETPRSDLLVAASGGLQEAPGHCPAGYEASRKDHPGASGAMQVENSDLESEFSR